MGRPCGAKKTSKIAHEIFFRKNAFSKLLDSPTDHRGNIEKVLHGCTTAFLPLYKSTKVALKFYNISVIRCTQNDHFRPFLWTALTRLNYSAATKSSIRKILYRCTSTLKIRTSRLLWNSFSILLLNGRSRAHKLCRSNFQKKNQILT